VTSQISEFESLDDPALLQRAAIARREAPGSLLEETLIYFLREAVYAGREDLINLLAEHLLRRCSLTVRRQLLRQGVDAANLDDAAQDVVGTLFGQIVDLGSDQGDYYQARFFDALASLSAKTAARYLRLQRQQAAAVALDGDDDAGAEEDGAPPPQVSDQDRLHPPPAGENLALMRVALGPLEPHIRQAFILSHYYDFPTESNDPAVPTLSTMFGKTPRTIRNWLTRAEEQLRLWRSEEQI
jgi:DNA-directed RNA polymerase specialized sigma24 family protein